MYGPLGAVETASLKLTSGTSEGQMGEGRWEIETARFVPPSPPFLPYNAALISGPLNILIFRTNSDPGCQVRD